MYGAFDPIQEIADICEKYNLWLHVDVSARAHRGASPFAGWGGTALLYDVPQASPRAPASPLSTSRQLSPPVAPAGHS